ncbi:MAG: dienelactone hydrolase family protein [Candidatus Dormibacteria bacterium]
MAGRSVTYPSNGSSAGGYLSVPEAGPGPGLVVIQEWWGVNDQIKRTADRFAAQGYTALVPDLYHGRVVGFHEPDQAQKELMAMDEARAARELRGAVDYLISSGDATGEYVGVVGYCMGGGLALSLAAGHEKVRAAISFYGTPAQGTDLGNITGAVQVHFGEADEYAPPEAVQQLRDGLQATKVPHAIYTYPGAHHAFANEDRPDAHDADADRLAWQRSLDFLQEQLPRSM